MIETSHTLTDPESVRYLFRKSEEDPGTYFVIFKNSTRCATSRLALKAFETDWKRDTPVYLVQVIESRTASDEVTRCSGVRHESPQLLLIRAGQVIHHVSHSRIDAHEAMRIMGSEPR
jgi:bacillithiol system protein YtxJ